MSEEHISKNDVGIAGEFYIAHILAKNGFKVNVSLGRTEGFDLFVQNPNGINITVSVKTRYPSKAKDILLSKKAETLIDENLFYAFVRLNMPDGVPEFWIIPSNFVASIVKKAYKSWKETPGRDGKSHKDTNMRTFELRAGQFYPDNWEKQLEQFKSNIESLKLL